jgi:D-glycero-alpha-D-manno-heptose-7-phosphate kinase
MAQDVDSIQIARLAGLFPDAQPDIFYSRAPVRICDLGGWTDTWFAEYGQVLNLAVAPRVHVQLAAAPSQGRGRVLIQAQNYGDVYFFEPGGGFQKHPLLEACVEFARVPYELDLSISLYSTMPAGASTGTSAAVAVALLGALFALQGRQISPAEIAHAAWRVETERLKQQSGIQDQYGAAFGGINLIQMDHYPHASRTQVFLPPVRRAELEQRLVLVYLGSNHFSSAIHEMVIRGLENAGPHCQPLQDLRESVPRGIAALQQGDIDAFGQALVANHEAQRRLHPALISAEADLVAGIAREFEAAGWKVNGAGGNGGSMTILGSAERAARQAMSDAITQRLPSAQVIPVVLDLDGLQVQPGESFSG